MRIERYNKEHLQYYTGILISEWSGGTFKMELKVEDNPVLERSVEEIDPSIELEFYLDTGLSILFFHDRTYCPTWRSKGECDECEKQKGIYDTFESNVYRLQIGDTFQVRAALINPDEKKSELLVRIQSFKDYEPLIVASQVNQLRLNDTPEGINHKYELEQQRLRREREAEDKRKADEEQAQKDAKRTKRKEKFQQIFGGSQHQIIGSAIGGVIAGLILANIANPIPYIFEWLKSIFYFLFF